MAMRTPVGDTLTLVQKAFFVVVDEGSLDCSLIRLVEREPQTVPVGGHAELLELGQDDAPVLVLPLPDAADKLLSPKPFLGQSLFLDLALDDRLRGNAGVVHPWQPERLEPLHALVTDSDVLERHIESVADMQIPRNIGGRHHDNEWCSVRVGLRVKSLLTEPQTIDLFLVLCCFVQRIQFDWSHQSSLHDGICPV